MIKFTNSVLLLCCLTLATTAYAKHKATLVFNAPTNQKETIILKNLKQAGDAQEVVNLVNQKLSLPKPLRLIGWRHLSPQPSQNLSQTTISTSRSSARRNKNRKVQSPMWGHGHIRSVCRSLQGRRWSRNSLWDSE